MRVAIVLAFASIPLAGLGGYFWGCLDGADSAFSAMDKAMSNSVASCGGDVWIDEQGYATRYEMDCSPNAGPLRRHKALPAKTGL